MTSKRDKLIGLGADALVDILLEIASESDSAQNKVQRAISDKPANVSLFKQKLRHLSTDSHFIPWKYSSSFSRKLSDLLQDIRVGASTPNEGLELVAGFFRADKVFFERVDDSSGHVGSVFTIEALEMFADYAKKVKDRTSVIHLVVDLARHDDYGVRGCLIEHANRFLSRDELRTLFDIVQSESKATKGKSDPWGWRLSAIAKQMWDAPLFEKLIRARLDGKVNSRFMVEIAEVYFGSGDVETAEKMLSSTSADDHFADYDRTKLKKKILRATKRTTELANVLLAEFKAHYCELSLNELLEVIGRQRKPELCQQAIGEILTSGDFDSTKAEFLIYCSAFDEAQSYLLNRASSIDGDYYSSLLPIAEAMEANKRYLAASVIYRALLDSILTRAKSKYYHHGVNYFQKLDNLSDHINDWANFPSHTAYVQELKVRHSRKPAFWGRLREMD